MYKFGLVCLFLFSSAICWAQPPNNDQVNALDITAMINGCSPDASYTTIAATADGAAGLCWANGPNYNVWFKFTATASQYIKVQVKTGGSEGTIQNPFVALWDAALTQLNCQNYQGASTDIETDYFGLTAGQTYYISVDNYGAAGYRGTFKLCLSDVVDYNFYEGAADVTSLINSCSADAAYTTLNATADRSAGSCWTNGPNYNRWFKFTATASQYIKVQVKTGGSEGTIQNLFVAIWDAALSQMTCQNYQGGSTDLETDYYGLTAGQTYYISVDNYFGPGYRGTFKLCLSDVPDYNFYEGASDVTSLINSCSADAAYTTLNATADRSAGSCWSNGPNYNRWFKFTATASQYIKVQVKTGGSEGTIQNPFVALWDAALTQLNCQNYQGASTDIETDYFGLTAGQTYYISVDNYGAAGYRGTFKLCLSDVVDYNFYEGAADVTSLINSCSADAAYTTLNATADRSAGSCWTNGPNYNRWFKFTATASQYIKVQVKTGGSEGTIQNLFVAIWDAALSQMTCQNYQGGSTDLETDYYGLTAGQTYYISVDNYFGPGYRGTFKLCLSDVPDYNFYEGASDVTSLINSCSADAAYTTLNATADRSAGSCWSNGPNYNRWFKFTATASQYIKVQVKTGGSEGTIQNPFVALWDAALTQLNCQNYQGASTDIETDYFGLTAGQTYYISVDNYGAAGYRGTFKLCLSDVVDYNFYEGAADVTSLINSCSADAAYTTLNATADRSAGSCWTNGPNYNRWFKFTATSHQYIKVQVKTGGSEGTIQNPFVALWDATLTQLTCQNYQGASVDIEIDYLGLTAGQTYYISVDNYVGTGYRGSFKLCLSDDVDYNYFEGASDITSMINGCSVNAAYTTLNATPDRSAGSCWSNGPNYNRWFRFIASSTGYIKVGLKTGGSEGTLQNPMLALWDASLTQLNCQNYQGASTDIETDYFGLIPGASYYISVDNYVGTGYRGTFTLCLSDVMDYNYYEGATLLTDLNNWCSANGQYTTLNATPDKNKGSCWSNGPNYNRWFKFVALYPTATVQVRVGGAEGSLQNPFVALWTANGTTQLACTNYAGASTDISLTYSSLTIGNTYYISVDNYIGAGYRGTFTLCVTNVNPTIFYSRADGDWSSSNTWSNVGYGGAASASTPVAGSVVNIRDNAVTVTSNQTCAEVNISVSAINTSLMIDNAALSVAGRFISLNSSNNSSVTTIQNNGLVSVANDVIVTRSGGSGGIQLNLPTGTINVGRDMIWNSSAGTISPNTISVSNASSISIARDLTLNSTGGMKIGFTFNNTSSMAIGRDMTFTASSAGMTEAVFNNTASMSIRRNIVRGGTPFGMLTFNNATVLTFNGTGNQQIIPASAGSGGDAITYRNVVINNTSGFATDFTMGGLASINSGLTMTAGVVQTTATNYLALLSGSACNLGSSSSFIDGPMTYDLASSIPNSVLNLPIGKGITYRPAVLTVSHSDNTPVTYTAEHFNASAAALGYTLPPTVDRVSGVRYWQISRQNVANLTDARATLYYGIGSGDGVTDYTNLTVVKNVGSGTTWFDVGGVATGNGTGSITSGSFTSFSIITLGNLIGGLNPLPVELTSFTGRSTPFGIALKWTTASEKNSNYFEVQRMTDEGYQSLGQLAAKGYSHEQVDYSFTDETPLNGENYYRLKQVDLDGTFTYSHVILVRNEVTSSGLHIQLYPNPVRVRADFVHVNVTGPQKNVPVLVSLLDINGKEVKSYRYKSLDSNNRVEVPTSELKPGIYLLVVQQGAIKKVLRLVVN